MSSPAFRHSIEQCNDFTGLEENTNRYDLLLLVKRVGRHAGFSPRMIALLDYYMAFTRDCDWEEGANPRVYQSVARTALDFGVSERQIQRIEKRLFEVGAIAFHDSGNHKRYGKRDSETGRLVFAFGVDLSPLAYLHEELERKLHEQQLYKAAWGDAKRQISGYRRQIRALLTEWEQGGCACQSTIQALDRDYQAIAVQIRTHLSLEDLRGLLRSHKKLHERVLKLVENSPAAKSFSFEKTDHLVTTSDKKVAHNKNTNPLLKTRVSRPSTTSFQKSVAEPTMPNDLILSSGIQHITLKQVLYVASQRFRGYLPLSTQNANWNDITEAANRMRIDFRISQQSWGEACRTLGRVGASLCVLLTDQAMQRDENRVRQPAAYFRGMIARADRGELRLHNSIFGLLMHCQQAGGVGSSFE